MPIVVGVVDQFYVPPPNLLERSTSAPTALANPYSGSGNVLARDGDRLAYGLHWAVNSAPPEAGTTGRSVLIYLEPYMSFSVHYRLSDLSDFIGETVLSGAAEGFHLFLTAEAESIAYHILPGWTVHLDWLIVP